MIKRGRIVPRRTRWLVAALPLVVLSCGDSDEGAQGGVVVSEPSSSTGSPSTVTPSTEANAGSAATSELTTTTTIVLEPGKQLLVRSDGGGPDSQTSGYLQYEPDTGCIYLLFPDSSTRYVPVWPPGTTATYPPLRIVEPLGSVKSEDELVTLRGGLHPWPESPYGDPVLDAAVRRCADRATDEVFGVTDDRL